VPPANTSSIIEHVNNFSLKFNVGCTLLQVKTKVITETDLHLFKNIHQKNQKNVELNYTTKLDLTDRICQVAVTSSKINADFSISSNINVTVRTVVTVTDTSQEVMACWHLVWCNMMRERTVGYLACASQKPTVSHVTTSIKTHI